MNTLHSLSTERAIAPRVVAGLCLAGLLGLVGCAATQPMFPYGQSPVDAPGFWVGLWHGCIAPVMFFVSLLRDHIRIYAFPNAGWRYDLGFMIGVGGFSHSVWVGATSGKRRDRYSSPVPSQGT